MDDHKVFLRRGQELGQLASASGNPPAGALIIYEGKVISEAHEASKTKNDITCHAEIEALRLAVRHLDSNDLSACVLYTNYEPCVMCAYAIRYYKVSKVVFQHSVLFFGSTSSPSGLLTTTSVPHHWAQPPEIIHVPEV